jgi:hypothetical protein
MIHHSTRLPTLAGQLKWKLLAVRPFMFTFCSVTESLASIVNTVLTPTSYGQNIGEQLLSRYDWLHGWKLA